MLLNFIFILSILYGKENIIFPERPRFLNIKKENIEEKEIKEIIKNANNFVESSIKVPEKEGGWIFDYYCRKDNSLLNAESEEKHICPSCGSIYTDEMTISAYRTHINYIIDRNCVNLGKAYILTGDEKYAEKVKQILLKLSSLYPKFIRHDRWGRKGIFAVVGGRRYAQNLDEAISAIYLSISYDLVANSSLFNENDKSTIENFLKNIVKEILKYQVFHGGRNNHQTWFNASYAVVGLVTGDEELIKESIYGKYGLLYQIENSITKDGLWYEGTISYHFYALEAIQYTLDAVKKIGWDFSKNDRLKSMWLGPIYISYPNGFLPTFNDGDPFNISSFKSFFNWAYNYFGDEIFSIYSQSRKNTFKVLKSINLQDIGIAVLRKGGEGKEICVMIDYGQHGGSHGHPDKLNIVLFANGRELLLDPGRLSYSVPEFLTWYKTTVAHNTVVIGEENQKPTTGKLIHFEDNDDFSFCIGKSNDAYEGYDLIRALLLTEKFLIDIFKVEGNKQNIIDLFIHIRGNIEEDENFIQYEYKSNKDGYKHLKNVKKLKEKNNGFLDFKIFYEKEKYLKLFLLNSKKQDILIGSGIGYNLNDRVPFILQRVFSNNNTFINIYDFNNLIKEVRIVPVGGEGNKLPIGLRIITNEETFEIGINLEEKLSKFLYDNREEFNRLLFKKNKN